MANNNTSSLFVPSALEQLYWQMETIVFNFKEKTIFNPCK